MFELAAPRRLEMPQKIRGGLDVEVFPRGDICIFATNHTATSLSTDARSQIHSVLRTCDYLLYEGTTTAKRRLRHFSSHAGERYVMETFEHTHPHNTYPLEEECNIYEMVERFGMDRNEMGAHILLSQYVHPIIDAKDELAAEKAVDFGIKNNLSIQDDFKSLDALKIKRRLMNIYRNKHILPSELTDKLIEDILRATSAFAITFRGFLSEYEYIGPNIKILMQELSGRKGIVIGKMHLEAVEKAVENEEFIRPPNWDTFINSLSNDRRNIVKISRGLMMDLSG